MPIATKNNSIIVKDGAVAENCNCCGGWVCYCDPNLRTCPPCEYASLLPDSLTATISLALSGTVYCPAVTNAFGFIEYFSYRVTTQNAADVSRSYTLSKVGQCEYLGVADSSRTVIRVVVGGNNDVLLAPTFGLGLGSSHRRCGSACQSALTLTGLALSVPCAVSPRLDFGGTSWTNATALEYQEFATTRAFFPCSYEPSSPTAKYIYGFYPDLTEQGCDVSPCVANPATTIYGQWSFDLLYTDTSGPSRVDRRLARALTLTVSQ